MTRFLVGGYLNYNVNEKVELCEFLVLSLDTPNSLGHHNNYQLPVCTQVVIYSSCCFLFIK